MFHPGETVSHKFTIPFLAEEVVKVVVTYKQDDHIILVKTITSGITPAEPLKATFTIAFSQEESLLFKEKKPFKIQLNVYDDSASRFASCEISSETGVQHYKEVMSNE